MARTNPSGEDPIESERRAAHSRPPFQCDQFPVTPFDEFFPFRRNIHLWLTGTFTGGGFAFIQEGDLAAKVKLGPVVFMTLAILVMAARRFRGRKCFSSVGFISANDIGKELERWSFKGEQVDAVKHIHSLRDKLAEAISEHMPRAQAETWAWGLIERDHVGYRLSAPPGQLHMDIVSKRPLNFFSPE
jgi:hypothetical protein